MYRYKQTRQCLAELERAAPGLISFENLLKLIGEAYVSIIQGVAREELGVSFDYPRGTRILSSLEVRTLGISLSRSADLVEFFALYSTQWHSQALELLEEQYGTSASLPQGNPLYCRQIKDWASACIDLVLNKMFKEVKPWLMPTERELGEVREICELELERLLRDIWEWIS